MSPPAADPLLSVYLLVEPLCAGMLVLDVGPRPPGALERLRAAGVREVLPVDGTSTRLPVPDGAVDLVMCATRLSALPGDAERQGWLAEMRRVLHPEGLCLARMELASFAGHSDPRQAFAELLGAHFPAVAVVSEAPLAAVSFVVAGADEVAVSEALASIAGEPTHLVAFAGGTPHPKWELAESLLVPTGPGGAAEALAAARDELVTRSEQHRAGCEERDGLREALMTAQDQLDRQDETLSSLRRETERHLRRSTEDAGALEVAQLERERSDRRAASAERALEALSAQLRERTAQLAAAEKELAALRGARPAARAEPPAPT